ncbi:beta-1,6-N-acetylglucosaminyltransferase [Actimicrobium antarcticum]|uniref:Peptide O-xylosyltransferase n=1 Tax=Actimicrobium antarcticum TaxID=1051899 RepID=A0ABP7T4Q4_9BURK
MKIAYLVLAHDKPRHLQRLITALSSASASFFVHIDKKSESADFEAIKGDRIRFLAERTSVFWGDFSQVEAILSLLRAAIADDGNFDRFVLLSGADYPLRSVSFIEQFFASHPGNEFMNLVAMPSAAAGKPISRLTTYRIRSGDSLLNKISQKIRILIGVLPDQRDYKTVFKQFEPFAGSTWWALSRVACEHILAFTAREALVVEFFKNTVCPDESFFQTILGNSRFRPAIVRNLTYTDWSAGAASPSVIDEQHLALLRQNSTFAAADTYGAGEMLFARKFNDDAGDLLVRLDQQLRS